MFISEVVRGGAAELDGRLMQGDQILSVDSEDMRHASQEAVAAILKVSPGVDITSCRLCCCSGWFSHTHSHTHTRLHLCPLQCARGPVQLELGRLKAASWPSSGGSQVSFFFFSSFQV